MFFETPFYAGNTAGFPDNTICLTFDDGPAEASTPPEEPGPHTIELAEYLASEDVQATFFMVGRQAQEYPDIPGQVSALGHQIGVHTYDHVGLDDYLNQNGDVVRQILLTAALLPREEAGPYYFRAPYGQWTGAVANALNADLLGSVSCFGPIHWDNSATDWDKWLDDVDPATVAQQYMDEIQNLGKGIILMHDNMANIRKSAAKNRGLALAMNLVPMLKDAGYQLSRLDAIEPLAAMASAPPRVALRSVNRSFVSVRKKGVIVVDAAAAGSTEELTVVPLSSNQVAFQSTDGQYFSLHQEDGVTVTATATEIGDWETFEAIPCQNGTNLFRTFTGDFLKLGDASALAGNGGQTDSTNRFSIAQYRSAAASSS